MPVTNAAAKKNGPDEGSKGTQAASLPGSGDDKTPESETRSEQLTSPATDADRPGADPQTANPTVEVGDRLGPLGTNSGRIDPANGTGFHCGICAQTVGKEGQHYNSEGFETEVPHANVVVVADNWAEKQDEIDREKRDEAEAKLAEQRAQREAEEK